jgi:hypothetical protein
MYSAALQTRGFEGTDSLRQQIEALESKNSELLSELQHYEQVRLSPRESLQSEGMMRLLLPPQGDSGEAESPVLDEGEMRGPMLRKTASADFNLRAATRRVVIANESTYLETPLYKSGILYRNSELELSAKYSRQHSLCHLTLVYRNWGGAVLEDVRMEISREPEGVKLGSRREVVVEGRMAADAQGLEMVQFECLEVFTDSPILTLSYITQREYKEITIKLPISIASYMTALPVPLDQMIEMYTNLASNQSSSQFPGYKGRISSKEILSGFLRYQGSFHVSTLKDTSDIGGIATFLDKTPVVFFIKRHTQEGGYELRCRSVNLQLREAVLQFLLTLIAG